VLFADPESNPWNVGVAPANLAQTIRNYLDRYNSPVLLIYNHGGYWHAVGIYGHDPHAETECQFVEDSIKYFSEHPAELRKKAAATEDERERSNLLFRADKLELTGRRTKAAYSSIGGCNKRGVFYVRDSVYSDPSEALYDYDPSQTGEERNYSKRIVLL
jgi:hypothetical protein